MKNRYLLVPLNNKGMEEYNFCIEDTDNILEIDLPTAEYNLLISNNIFSKFNETFILNISDYECEEINTENLSKAFEIIKPIADKLPVFVSCLNIAIEKGTLLGINL
ncbi:MAG: hypothetical protein PUG48_01005 [Clostridia bacterium]|nr:hypothetical protein [Clostridia bacterium]